MSEYALLIDGETILGISNNNAKGTNDVTIRDVLSWSASEPENSATADSNPLRDSFTKAVTSMGTKDGVPLALPPDILVTRILTLPALDHDSLDSMVRLAMEKFAPVSDSDLEVDYEVVGATESTTRVFAVCVPTTTLNKIAEDLEASGLLITRLDSSLLCEWHSYAKQKSLAPEAIQAILFSTASGRLDLIIADATGPLFARTFGYGLTPSDITREIMLSFMDFAAENNSKQPEAFDIVISNESKQEGLLNAVVAAVGITPTILREDSLFPYVASVLQREEQDGCIDIVPTAWREEEEESISRQNFKNGIMVAVALWVLIVASYFIIPWLQKRQTDTLDAQLKSITPAYRQISELRSRVRLISTYEDRTFSFIDKFKEICNVMPIGITLTTLSYDKGSEAIVNGKPSPGGFKLSATSETPSQVNDFVNKLNEMGYFQAAKLTGPNLDSKREHYKFEVDLRFGGENAQ